MTSYIFNIKFAVITVILTPVFILSATSVHATELVISGNDPSSVTEIVNGSIQASLVSINCCNTTKIDDPMDLIITSAAADGNSGGNPTDDPPIMPKSVDNLLPQASADLFSFIPLLSGHVMNSMIDGQILPNTGVSWTLILSLVSLIMFMQGLYLRRHPGVDPGKMSPGGSFLIQEGSSCSPHIRQA